MNNVEDDEDLDEDYAPNEKEDLDEMEVEESSEELEETSNNQKLTK